MTSHQKKNLDYIPLAILIISAIILLWRIEALNIELERKHYLGLILIGSTLIIFLVRHVYGVFALGIILFLGLIGIYSFDPGVLTTTYFAGEYGQGYSITLFLFQPIFILWIALHFILSWKNYSTNFSKTKRNT